MTETDLDSLRARTRALCSQFPDEYWRETDLNRRYPQEFVDTLTAALDTLFGGDAGAAGGDDQVEPTEPDPDTGEVPTEPTAPTDVEAEALAAAQQALTDREAALKEGDLTKFAEADKRLTDAVNTLLGLEQGAGE